MLGILDLERPVLRLRLVNCSKALVARVSVPPNGQQVDVSVPHPGHLKRRGSMFKVVFYDTQNIHFKGFC